MFTACLTTTKFKQRVDPLGYDSRGKIYYLLDDNRLYRKMPEALPKSSARNSSKPMPQTNSPARKWALRSSLDPEGDVKMKEEEDDDKHVVEWECICMEYDDWVNFTNSLRRSKDADERAMHQHIVRNVIPKLEEDEDEREQERQARELLYQKEQLIASRKRSSRIIAKEQTAKEREERERAEMEARMTKMAATASRHELKRIEKEREERARSREVRILEREKKAQEQAVERQWRETHPNGDIVRLTIPPLANNNSNQRHSHRHAERQKRHADAQQDTADWQFDCICGFWGINVDDGSLSVACERCQTWHHVACLRDNALKQELIARDANPDAVMLLSPLEYYCDRCVQHMAERKANPVAFEAAVLSNGGRDDSTPSLPLPVLQSNGHQHSPPLFPTEVFPSHTVTSQPETALPVNNTTIRPSTFLNQP